MATETRVEDYPLRRVLFRLSLLHLDFSHLEIAARLASERHAELIALCMENMELLRSSQLPFTGQIGLVTGRRLPWQEDQLARELARMQRRLREHLDRFAMQQPLRWKMILETEQTESRRAFSAADELLVISRPLTPEKGLQSGPARVPDRTGDGKGPVLLLGQRHGPLGFVIALVADPEREQRLLSAAESMARLTGRPLNILCTGPETACSVLADQYRHRKQVVNFIRAEAFSVRLLEKLAAHGKYLLVLSGQAYDALAPHLSSTSDVLIVP